jgi:hypothetical protein
MDTKLIWQTEMVLTMTGKEAGQDVKNDVELKIDDEKPESI